MAIQVVTLSGNSVALTNSVRTQYIDSYMDGMAAARFYDQLAEPIGQPMATLQRGSAVQVQYLSDMAPGTATISEVADVDPQTLRDAVASITPTSRGEALKASELLMLQNFTGYHREMLGKVGKNMMETVEGPASDAATQGSLVQYGVSGPTARTSLDAGATGHRADNTLFMDVSGVMTQLKTEGYVDPKNGSSSVGAFMHNFVYHDILKSGSVTPAAQYQNISLLLNHELGEISGYRLVASPFAKVFYGAGAANAKSVDTVISTALTALSKTLNISNTSSIEQGRWLNILDTRETGNTHVQSNERVKYVSASNKTITFVGNDPNGGVRFDHASGTTVNNHDSAYPIVFGGPKSLAKVFATEVGEFGQIVGPRRDGTLDQWVEIGWKWYGGYGRLSENKLYRAEVAVSYEA